MKQAPLKLKEVAVRLGVCTKTVRRRIADRELQAVKFSKRDFRVEESELRRYMERSRA